MRHRLSIAVRGREITNRLFAQQRRKLWWSAASFVSRMRELSLRPPQYNVTSSPLTAVERVAIHYGTPQQTELKEIRLDELKRLDREGHFPLGSMGPKIAAAIRFIEGGGKRAMIGHLDQALATLLGESGTHVVP